MENKGPAVAVKPAKQPENVHMKGPEEEKKEERRPENRGVMVNVSSS